MPGPRDPSHNPHAEDLLQGPEAIRASSAPTPTFAGLALFAAYPTDP